MSTALALLKPDVKTAVMRLLTCNWTTRGEENTAATSAGDNRPYGRSNSSFSINSFFKNATRLSRFRSSDVQISLRDMNEVEAEPTSSVSNVEANQHQQTLSDTNEEAVQQAPSDVDKEAIQQAPSDVDEVTIIQQALSNTNNPSGTAELPV